MAPDTIVAIATPAGAGGIGIVRLSGPRAAAIADRLVEPGQAERVAASPPRTLVRTVLRVGGDLTDDALIASMPGPHSYTGEDVVEVHTHGSPVLLHAVVQTAVAAGARLARPGEFTQRAFLNGRMDLTQAEAVADLIAARTAAAARCAGRQLRGGLREAVERHRDTVLRLLAELEAGLDFSEEELDLPTSADYYTYVVDLQAALDGLLDTAPSGRLLHDGATVAIVGKPNAGKSSLFNALLKHERAIVTAEPGTTRDTVDGEIDLDGVPLRLIDTAGARAAQSEAEALGIDRSRAAAADADVILWVVDGAEPWDEEDGSVGAADRARTILVLNKSDLPRVAEGRPLNVVATVEVSAKTGAGLDALHGALRAGLRLNGALTTESPVIVRARHVQALGEACDALRAAAAALQSGVTLDCVSIDLRQAMDALGTIVGSRTTEDLLNHIFGEFCIGK